MTQLTQNQLSNIDKTLKEASGHLQVMKIALQNIKKREGKDWQVKFTSSGKLGTAAKPGKYFHIVDYANLVACLKGESSHGAYPDCPDADAVGVFFDVVVGHMTGFTAQVKAMMETAIPETEQASTVEHAMLELQGITLQVGRWVNKLYNMAVDIRAAIKKEFKKSADTELKFFIMQLKAIIDLAADLNKNYYMPLEAYLNVCQSDLQRIDMEAVKIKMEAYLNTHGSLPEGEDYNQLIAELRIEKAAAAERAKEAGPGADAPVVGVLVDVEVLKKCLYRRSQDLSGKLQPSAEGGKSPEGEEATKQTQQAAPLDSSELMIEMQASLKDAEVLTAEVVAQPPVMYGKLLQEMLLAGDATQAEVDALFLEAGTNEFSRFQALIAKQSEVKNQWEVTFASQQRAMAQMMQQSGGLQGGGGERPMLVMPYMPSEAEQGRAKAGAFAWGVPPTEAEIATIQQQRAPQGPTTFQAPRGPGEHSRQEDRTLAENMRGIKTMDVQIAEYQAIIDAGDESALKNLCPILITRSATFRQELGKPKVETNMEGHEHAIKTNLHGRVTDLMRIFSELGLELEVKQVREEEQRAEARTPGHTS